MFYSNEIVSAVMADRERDLQRTRGSSEARRARREARLTRPQRKIRFRLRGPLKAA